MTTLHFLNGRNAFRVTFVHAASEPMVFCRARHTGVDVDGKLVERGCTRPGLADAQGDVPHLIEPNTRWQRLDRHRHR